MKLSRVARVAEDGRSPRASPLPIMMIVLWCILIRSLPLDHTIKSGNMYN